MGFLLDQSIVRKAAVVMTILFLFFAKWKCYRLAGPLGHPKGTQFEGVAISDVPRRDLDLIVISNVENESLPPDCSMLRIFVTSPTCRRGVLSC